MALSLESLRSLGLTNLFGRRLSLDSNDYLVGPRDLRRQIEDISSTVATTLAAFGITRILTSGSSQGPTQHTLPTPIPGVTKHIVMNTTSTGSVQFLSTANGASILAASDGTTKSLVNLLGQGGSVTLQALSSAIWAVVGYTSTGSVTYTTST